MQSGSHPYMLVQGSSVPTAWSPDPQCARPVVAILRTWLPLVTLSSLIPQQHQPSYSSKTLSLPHAFAPHHPSAYNSSRALSLSSPLPRPTTPHSLPLSNCAIASDRSEGLKCCGIFHVYIKLRNAGLSAHTRGCYSWRSQPPLALWRWKEATSECPRPRSELMMRPAGTCQAPR